MKLYFLLILAIYSNYCHANLCLTDPDTSKVVEFSHEYPYCKIVTRSDDINDLIQKHPEQFQIVNNEVLEKMEETCKTKPEHGFIYPGTLWCGRGTKATNYSQLGEHANEDMCCRDHDNCPTSITAGECIGDLCNDSRFTRSHCDCDQKFQKCLQNTQTETGNTIGAIFFNVAQIFCVREQGECNNSDEILDSDESNELRSCSYEFAQTDKYKFSPPFFTYKNRRAFFLNMLLRKLNIFS